LSWPSPSRVVWAILRRHLDVFRRTYRTNLMPHFVDPLFWMAAFGLGLGAYMPDIRGVGYLQWFAPAMLVSSAMWSSAYECTYGTYIRLKYPPLFESMLAAPATLDDVALSEVLWAGGKSAGYSVIILAVLFVVGLVPAWTGLLLPLVILLEGVLIAALSLVFAATARTIDAFAFYYTLGVTPMFVLSGIFFPLDGLPVPLQWLAWLNPLSHFSVLARGLAIGTGAYAVGAEFWRSALWVAVAALLVVPVGTNLMRRRLAR
jgi:lipooligosaccharide transport system permease protein